MRGQIIVITSKTLNRPIRDLLPADNFSNGIDVY